MPLLAHAGHWLVNFAYFVPVVGFLVWLAWTELRGRRERRQRPDDGHASAGDSAS
ncbi:MAG: hypothetical protein WD993_00195 [Thermoleophilaceae bacterium]